jgi:hypothetical protein
MTEMGQADVRPVSLEQPAPKFGFQILNRSRERRLRDTATSGRSGETLFLTEGEEVENVMRLHWHCAAYRAASSIAFEMMGDAIAAPSNRTNKASQIVAIALSPRLEFFGRSGRDPLFGLIGRIVGLLC